MYKIYGIVLLQLESVVGQWQLQCKQSISFIHFGRQQYVSPISMTAMHRMIGGTFHHNLRNRNFTWAINGIQKQPVRMMNWQLMDTLSEIPVVIGIATRKPDSTIKAARKEWHCVRSHQGMTWGSFHYPREQPSLIHPNIYIFRFQDTIVIMSDCDFVAQMSSRK